ncbi:MAG TPA: sulfurtransferase TusA family protein [Rhodobacteraceae bacterium]|nr:sulfurtransferase TusA family protein [Paracoccaceae bacterium]
MQHDDDLDARGFLCPLPVLKARKRLLSLEKNQVLRLVTDDPAALVDVPHFCAEQGYSLTGQEENGAEMVFYIRK